MMRKMRNEGVTHTTGRQAETIHQRQTGRCNTSYEGGCIGRHIYGYGGHMYIGITRRGNLSAVCILQSNERC